MSLLFDRKYRVSWGQRGVSGVGFTGLRCAFSIERDSESGANTATIQLWNLSKDSISELQRPGVEVSLEAGYGNVIGMIFTGNDIKLSVRREVPDIITEIRVQDGGIQLRKQVTSLGFEPGAVLRDVVTTLVKEFKNLSISDIDLAKIREDGLAQGLIASGPTKKILDDLLKSQGFQWSVQDGEVRIVADDATTDEAAIKLTPSTGMIGTPTRTEDGIVVTSLLNPRIRPYRRLQIESEQFAVVTGQYKVDKVTHRGDSWGRDWYTIAECRSR